MWDDHQKLVDQYNEIKKKIGSGHTKALFLEISLVTIVCAMKAMQTNATLNLNIIATACVCILVVWHFWGFKLRRTLDRKITSIVLEGIELEKQNPFAGSSFFQSYLKTFTVLGQLLTFAIFDVVVLYFFSVSVTQLIKALNPEIAANLMPTAPLRTLIISIFFGIAYYLPVRPLAQAKRSIKGI